MDLAEIDLNLMVVLDALLEERHVTRAATRLGLSQPAMSRSLGRLRKLVGDPLLVRAGHELVPTPRALELGEPLRAMLDGVRRMLETAPPFDAATAERTFVIMANEYAQIALAPAVLDRVRARAPGVRIDLRHLQRQSAMDALATGRADLV